MPSVTAPIIQISGRYMYRDGERFIVRGAVYQTQATHWNFVGPQDPISDDRVKQVRRDIVHFKELGVNALWIYNVDPTLSHDVCMSLLAGNGIYIVACLSSNKRSIHRNNPRASYTADLRRRYQEVVDCMSSYTNVFGVCVAGSLINNGCEKGLISELCEIVGIAIHDLKNYMQSQHVSQEQRILPVCISDDFWTLLNTHSFEYMTGAEVEGRPEKGTVDFYCFTHYQPAEGFTIPQSTGRHRQEPRFKEMHLYSKFTNMKQPLPILLSEYSSSNNVRPRRFDQVTDLYSTSEMVASAESTISSMLQIFSGGFVYEYNEGFNTYGLVKEEQDGSMTKLPDFYSFKDKMMATLDSHTS